jgi:hypothetical protein
VKRALDKMEMEEKGGEERQDRGGRGRKKRKSGKEV